MKRALSVLICLCTYALVADATAHAHLDRATPAAGSSVHSPPKEVKLWFSQALEPAFSTIKVLDRDGQAVDAGSAGVDARDRTLLRAVLRPVPPGTYRVVWRVLSIDTHVSEGEFSFDVVP